MITALDRVALAIASQDMHRHIHEIGNAEYKSATAVSRIARVLVEGLNQAQVFEIDNVTEWLDMLGMSPRKTSDFFRELPSCYPPYTFTYMEWRPQGTHLSAFAVCPQQSIEDGRLRAAQMMVFEHYQGETFHLGTTMLNFDSRGQIATAPDDEGLEYPYTPVVVSPAIMQARKQDPELDHEMNQLFIHAITTALFTFSLLHCTNVSTIEVDPRATMSRQQRRDLERKQKDPVIYKVLQVKPLGGYRKSAAERPGEGRTKRLHHVRGHFMEFGPEYGKGLAFGRIAGRFYCPPHIRGDLGEGVVSKTYKLAKPTGKEDHDGWRDR